MSNAGASIDDLYRIDGRAELIGGVIVRYPPMGYWPAVLAGRILRKLADHADTAGRGVVHTRSLAYVVPRLPSGRESLSPDASYYTGALPENPMRFIEGPPDFAVEVRSENEYGPAAERAMAAKRKDYFEAGTLVIWDVDPDAKTVTSYRVDAPTQPTPFRGGDTADAEPAVPGWRLSIDWLMAGSGVL
jgi:Uma2 family endonuclease